MTDSETPDQATAHSGGERTSQLEERLKKLEHRLKLAPIAIAALALFATAASAVAAWSSYSLATKTAETQGAVMYPSTSVHIVGSCQDKDHPLMVRFKFFNKGHLAGSVSSIVIAIYNTADNPPHPQPNEPLSYITAGSLSTETKVEAQNNAYALVKVNCEILSKNGVDVRSAGTSLADLINQHQPQFLVVGPTYGLEEGPGRKNSNITYAEYEGLTTGP